MPCQSWYGSWGGYGFGGGILGPVLNLVFTAALFAGLGLLIWWMASRLGFVGHGRSGIASSDGAMAILDERFARGEISLEEYTEKKRTLKAK